jgi:hypothetical protein
MCNRPNRADARPRALPICKSREFAYLEELFEHQQPKNVRLVFEWLERAYKQRDAGLPDIKVDPLLRALRHDPRYTELLKKMHLPT